MIDTQFIRKAKFHQIRAFIPIRIKLLVLFASVVVITGSLIFILFYSIMESEFKKNALIDLQLMIDQASNAINKSFDEIELTFYQYYASVENDSFLSADVSNEMDTYERFQINSQINHSLLEESMFNPAWMDPLIYSIHVFLNDDVYSSIHKTVRNNDAINAAIFDFYKMQSIPSNASISFCQVEANRSCFLVKKTFESLPPSQRSDMTMIIGVNETYLHSLYESLLQYDDAVGYIVDNHGIVYSSSDNSMLGKPLDASLFSLAQAITSKELDYKDQSYIFASRTISSGLFYFVIGIPIRPILTPFYHELYLYLLAVGIITMASLTFGISFTLRMTGFIKKLQTCMDKIKAGNYDVEMPAYNEADITNISETFNSMTAQIKYLINEVYSKQLYLKEAELKYLQAQMNPHFIFNVLLSIGYRAKLSNDDQTYEMISCLLDLLQASIYSEEKDMVPIAKELGYIRSYLYLQNMRFEDRLQFSISLENESDLIKCLVPRLCIEPIVENAVVHGLENKCEEGFVSLSIREEEGSVVFDVADNGVGFSEDSLRKFYNDGMAAPEQHHGFGIGLKNSDRRIKLIFGEQYGIEIKSAPLAGSHVSVRIPKLQGDPDNV